jgi:predicted nuclease of predicted toxin-antitoxin system
VKALLDLNLSFRLVDIVLPQFPGSRHVKDFGLTGDDDERIWTLPRRKGS